MTRGKIPLLLKAFLIGFGVESIAAFIWITGGPYSSAPSIWGHIGWILHAPGILLLVGVPWFYGAPEFLLWAGPPVISLLLWTLLVWAFLDLFRRRRAGSGKNSDLD